MEKIGEISCRFSYESLTIKDREKYCEEIEGFLEYEAKHF